jgi:uncharacterized protein YdaU (DUF1376 family)
MNWYPHYYGDYMRDTSHLSLVEHGAYRTLLDHYYATGPMPDCDVSMMRICRAFDETEKQAVLRIARDYFPVNGDGLRHNKRADQEIAKRDGISMARAMAGAKGAESKWNGKRNGKKMAIATTSTSTSTDTTKATSKTTSTSINPVKYDGVVYTSGEILFEKLWEDYGRIGAKKKANAYWRKLAPDQMQGICDAMGPYLRVVAAGRRQKDFEGWINPANEIWAQDWEAQLAEWSKDDNKSKGGW